MKAYQQRIVDEENDLIIKRKRLYDFLHTDIYAGLSDGERGELQAQYIVMGNYLDILQTRTERF